MDPANFEYWDTVSDFDPREIGWLWCGLEPPGKPGQTLPAMGNRILWDIREALDKGQLARASRYSRSALRDWAETHSVFKPRFLFIPQPAADLTLENALRCIRPPLLFPDSPPDKSVTTDDPPDYHTPALDALQAAIIKFWLNHDPSHPPKKKDIIQWLIEHREMTPTMADHIDQVIRPEYRRRGGNTRNK